MTGWQLLALGGWLTALATALYGWRAVRVWRTMWRQAVAEKSFWKHTAERLNHGTYVKDGKLEQWESIYVLAAQPSPKGEQT